jgi:hypothetical protein
MRLSLWCICAAILFALTGCDVFPFDHVLEIHCDQDTEFDNNKLCLKPNRPGAELAFRVNERTQKVLITIVKNDGSYFGGKDLFLEHCSIVDDLNWKCRDTNGLPVSAPFYHQNDYAMVHGRYYHSLTGGGPPNFYTSSIKGLAFLGLYYGIINMRDALTKTGYSAQAIDEAWLRCAAWRDEDWCKPCYGQGECRRSPTR